MRVEMEAAAMGGLPPMVLPLLPGAAARLPMETERRTGFLALQLF